jgi:hypothetical protein
MAEPEPNFDPGEPLTAGQWFKYALGCYAAAVVLFLVFYGLELIDAGGLMPSWMVFLYGIGGKWLVAGIVALIGTTCLILGIRESGKSQGGPGKGT